MIFWCRNGEWVVISISLSFSKIVFSILYFGIFHWSPFVPFIFPIWLNSILYLAHCSVFCRCSVNVYWLKKARKQRRKEGKREKRRKSRTTKGRMRGKDSDTEEKREHLVLLLGSHWSPPELGHFRVGDVADYVINRLAVEK